MEHLSIQQTPKDGQSQRRVTVSWFAQPPIGKSAFNGKSRPLQPRTLSTTRLLKVRVLSRSRVKCGPSLTKATLKHLTSPTSDNRGIHD